MYSYIYIYISIYIDKCIHTYIYIYVDSVHALFLFSRRLPKGVIKVDDRNGRRTESSLFNNYDTQV